MKILPPSFGSIGEISSEPDPPELSRQNAQQDVIESAQSEPNTFAKLIESASQNPVQITAEDVQKNPDVASQESATEVNSGSKEFSDVAEKIITGVAIDVGLVAGTFTFGLSFAPFLGAAALLDFSDVSNAISDGADAVANAVSDAAGAVADAVSDALDW